jgi:hypothetical protein
LATGARAAFLLELKTLFGIDSRDLEMGFTYLGYFIKPTSYKAKDWGWLYEKFERRIQHWCNRCLSIGGRYILIKAVLESLPVYWMALAYIPQSVLTKLRKLIFAFLWKNNKQSRGFHLCRWETLSKPKALGGWGLRNLHLSYLALSANTLWRILMVPGIWHNLIKDKYLAHLPVHSWLRSATFSPLRGSQTWKHLQRTLPILLHWIAWLPGNGSAIELGKDDILGMGIKAQLSSRLLERLHNLGHHYLFHLKAPHNSSTLGESWITSSMLLLDRELSAEWIRYTQHLNEAGICLQERPDNLIWTGGDKSGIISVRNIYKALTEEIWPTRDQTWRTRLWKWKCPLKLKLFTWLLTENKLLVWDILQSKGWSGPNRCILCKENSETSYHLFVSCIFTQQVWHQVTEALKLTIQWLGPSTSSCFSSWCSRQQPLPLAASHHLLECLVDKECRHI